MIDPLTQSDLEKLVQPHNDPCVTIYLPTEKTGREIFKPAKHLEQLVKSAADKLSGHWMSNGDAKTFLDPVFKLAKDHEFWQHTDEGLAIFLSADQMRTWRIGRPVAEQVFVSDLFFVRSILPAVGNHQPFYVLSLSRNESGFYEAAGQQIRRVEVPGMPQDIREALNTASVDRGSQVHAGSPGSGGKQGAVFHGQGGRPETSKRDLQHYYRQVNQAVTKYVGKDRRPMVLACVADQVSVYRDVNSYPNLINEVAAGAADRLPEKELLNRALPCLLAHTSQARAAAVESYRRQANTARSAAEISDVVKAAHNGRVDRLFVHQSASVPGEYNSSELAIDYDVSSGDFDKDLVESVIAQTLRQRGEVYALSDKEMPDSAQMVATLRY